MGPHNKSLEGKVNTEITQPPTGSDNQILSSQDREAKGDKAASSQPQGGCRGKGKGSKLRGGHPECSVHLDAGHRDTPSPSPSWSESRP